MPGSWPARARKPSVVRAAIRTSLHRPGAGQPGREGEDGETMSSTHETGGQLDLGEAARQLEMAAHDARVAVSCIGLGDLDGAHTHALLARTAADGAQNLLQAALAAGVIVPQ